MVACTLRSQSHQTSQTGEQTRENANRARTSEEIKVAWCRCCCRSPCSASSSPGWFLQSWSSLWTADRQRTLVTEHPSVVRYDGCIYGRDWCGSYRAAASAIDPYRTDHPGGPFSVVRPAEAEAFTVQIELSASLLIIDSNRGKSRRTEVSSLQLTGTIRRSGEVANNETACQELTPSEFLPSRITDSGKCFHSSISKNVQCNVPTIFRPCS